MKMRCLYCDEKIDKIFLSSLWRDDLLCVKCRKKLKPKLRIKRFNGLKVYYLYDYDDFFKSVLMQYKEVCDEALKEIFIYRYDYLFKCLFKKYEILYVPSSKEKNIERGFLPMAEIMKQYKAKKYAEVYMKEELVQAHKPLYERQKMKNNYYLIKEVKESDYIMVVDDVFTTGSSITGVLNALGNKSKHIIVFVLAMVNK